MTATVFRKGQFTAGSQLVTNHLKLHATVKRRWNDGSPKHVVFAGRANFAGSSLALQASVGTPATAPMSAVDIVAANPQASVTLGTLGNVSLTGLLASAPFRTWLATPDMVECHYVHTLRSPGASVDDIYVWFQVRCWSGNHTWVRVIVEHNRLPVTGVRQIEYKPVVNIGGVQVWNNGGLDYVHALGARWSREAWVTGGADVVARHDPEALRRTRMVPNYFATTSTEAQLNALTQTYTPGQVADLRSYYPGTGYSTQIGLLPEWDMRYATTGDARAWRAVQVNSLAAGSHGVTWRDPATRRMARPSDWPTWTLSGHAQGGWGEIGAAYRRNAGGGLDSHVWDTAHNASSGYLAYLVTGDYLHLETMHAECAAIYLVTSSGNGSGTARRVFGQTRSQGWFFRSVGQLTALAPDGDTVAVDMGNWLYQNVLYHKANGPDGVLACNSIGLPVTIGTYNPSAPLSVAPWMHHFWIMSMGHVSEIEALSDARMTDFNLLRDWMYRGIVGYLGDGSAGTYDYRYAGRYTMTASSLVKPDYSLVFPPELFNNWGQVWSAMLAQIEADASSGGWPKPSATTQARLYASHFGYFNNLLPAIAYAVDHGAPGAAAAWGRLTSAINWNDARNSAIAQPVWAIEPRN